MAESSSSWNLRLRRRTDGDGEGETSVFNIRCRCELLAREGTSWTAKNPARRFLGCPNFMDPSLKCNFFKWLEPELDLPLYRRKLYVVHEELLAAQEEAMNAMAALYTSEAETREYNKQLELSNKKMKVMRGYLLILISCFIIVIGLLVGCIYNK